MQHLARRILAILVLAVILRVNASANSFVIPNVTMGSGTVVNGQAITFDLRRVGNTFVGFQAVNGTASPNFTTPPGYVLRDSPPRIMPNGSSAVFLATCQVVFTCGVVFDAAGNATTISQPGGSIEVTAILNDNTWIGRATGVGASYGTIGQTTISPITATAQYSAYAAALQTGLVTTVGAVTNGGSSYAAETIAGVLSLLPNAGPNSAAFGLSPDGQIRVGNNGLLASQWTNSGMSYFQLANSTLFQEGFAYSATNGGAVSGSDLDDIGFLYLPLYGRSFNACAGVVEAGGVLQAGQTVENCTLGRTYVAGELYAVNGDPLNLAWNYTVFASGSDHKYTNLNPYAFNAPGWQPTYNQGGGSPVPEPGTWLLCSVAFMIFVAKRDLNKVGVTVWQSLRYPPHVYTYFVRPRAVTTYNYARQGIIHATKAYNRNFMPARVSV